MRSAWLTMVLVALPVGLAGQAADFPEGWQGRLDRPNADLANVRFETMGTGLHVTTGPHVILYNPANRADGAYRVSASFTQMKATAHPEGYGLLVGGRDLDGPGQDYLYFLVRQDGRFMIRHRAGDEVHTIQEWTEHPAVVAIEGEGRATNTLAIEAGPQRATFLVNGTEVAAFMDVPHLNTAGIAGIRVSHNLDLHVEGVGIQR